MKLIMSDRPISLEIGENKDIKYIDLSSMKIANCVGCFGCWTKTPGKCVIRDDATKVYPYIAECSSVIYVSHIKYGGYDSVMKTMICDENNDREGYPDTAGIHTHTQRRNSPRAAKCGNKGCNNNNVQRNVAIKDAIIIAYGDTDSEEQEIFRQLVERNARNMNFGKYEIVFVTEQEVEETVKNELKKWEK